MVNGQQSRAKKGVQSLTPSPLAGNAGTGRRERRAAETRLRLFRCALELFAKRGFSSVTVEDITEAADVGKGTFFNYFESKDHVLGVMAEVQLARIGDVAPLVSAGRQTIYKTMHRLALSLAEEPGRSPELARALIGSFSSSEVVRGLIDDRMSEGRRLFAGYIEQGQTRGEIDPRLDREMVAAQFQQAVMGTILLWSLHGGPSLAERMEESFQHFWRAVVAPHRGAGGEQSR
jgi:AcrR family transcriptional regulator